MTDDSDSIPSTAHIIADLPDGEEVLAFVRNHSAGVTESVTTISEDALALVRLLLHTDQERQARRDTIRRIRAGDVSGIDETTVAAHRKLIQFFESSKLSEFFAPR